MVSGIAERLLKKYDFYQDLEDGCLLFLMINLWINPLYSLINMANIRKGLLDLVRSHGQNMPPQETPIAGIAMRQTRY